MRRILFLFTVALLAGMAADETHESVVRATLDNGLRVVIIRDPLAPVITIEENYLAGGNDTPAGFPGTAHAQEHMAFRGCAGLTADQIAAIYAQLGGSSNADTQQNITQYFITVPAQDVEVALRVDSACMQDAQDSRGPVGRRNAAQSSKKCPATSRIPPTNSSRGSTKISFLARPMRTTL